MSTFQIDFGNDKPPIIGIDLGTTNSLVAVMGPTGQPEIIPSPEGGNIVPSILALADSGELLVGAEARESSNALYSVKRFMGRSYEDLRPELALFPFEFDSDSGSVVKLKLEDRSYTPPQVGAEILKKLKANAEVYLGQEITQAVITVPAYFNDAQRQATKDAGRIAGLEVLRLVNEPTAASLAYGLDKRKQGVIAVYDFGGGTFDISILKIENGIFEVLATNGDTHLGGDDIDNLLLQIAAEDIASEGINGLDRSRLRRAVIQAKEELSFVPETTIALEGYSRHITRELFDKLITPIIERTIVSCRQCIADAAVTVEQIVEVVMVGGSTRIPLVRSAVETLFRAKPHTDLNPDEVVALGAAVQAGILSGSVEDTLLLDVTPLSLGIETMGGVVSKIIHRNSTIPASATQQFTTAVDGQRNVLIHVVQGERELVQDCRSLARFDLKDIDPVPAGFARIDVRFLIDANGILNVTARDNRSGKEQSVEIQPSYGLTDNQVEAMIQESFANAEQDFKARQVREMRVEADGIIAATEKARRNDAWFELSDEERQGVDLAVNQLLMVYNSEDHHLIHSHIEKLNAATATLAENMMNTAVRGALKGTKIE